MVMKFQNVDICYNFCYIFDLSSALACRMEIEPLGRSENSTSNPIMQMGWLLSFRVFSYYGLSGRSQ